ncbi:hypothetical protein HGH93_29965 [Chitinophaga polysaccharea]|uniref:hypothetical protein n=1 Tax=Chitinophaga polysaccharea TaxID=1293035 RepID=UPI001455039F|nr:hypothetical protein [Chitinophaga polysaccharea]NLR62356.1 hypothetical protein [Chitinophaga polysaccharea]
MKYIWMTALALISVVNSMAQMKAPEEWVNYESVMGVKNRQRHYDYSVMLTRAAIPSNVLWPGEQPSYTIQVVNELNEPLVADGKIELISYATKGRPGDIWLPEMERHAMISSTPVKVKIDARGYVNLEHAPQIPNRFGGYALVLDLGTYGRRFITSLVRTFKANPQRIQYPKQSLDDMGADFLQRVGVQAIRMGVDYTPTTANDYTEKMAALNRKLEEYKEKNITVLLMFGAGTAPLPLGRPRSFLDSAGVMKKTKQDFVWAPSSDHDFQEFVHRLCVKYGWPKGPVTAVSLWNEPWEGASISGWQSDIPRYREIYTVMAQAVLEARKRGADVLVGGGDSNSNAWDKLFADGKMTFLPIFDFCSIHYQGIESPAIYPDWVNRKSPHGRVKIWDTESWVGNTDDRIGLTVATCRSAGYDRSMGIYAGYMYTGGRGSERFTQQIHTPAGMKEMTRIPDTWSQAAALGAVQHLVGERDFKQLLFTNGLPWVMVFDGTPKQPDDGTVVVCGDIGEAFGPEHVLFRGVRGLSSKGAYEPLQGGSMTLPAAGVQLYDFYGNNIAPVAGKLVVPLNSQGYFLRTNGSKGSFARLLQTLKTARIEGYEPVEIIAHDMTARIEQRPVMPLQLTNILNRPVNGNLQVTLGGLPLRIPDTVQLAPHETRIIPVKITGGTAAVNNTYPLRVRFDAGADGVASHQEDMHVNVISRLGIHVDGKLDDWKTALPQTVSSSGAATVSVTEAAWYPFKNFDTNANGYANGYFAYDDQYFYFASKVADSTPHPGTYRFEHRPDDEFFYPDTAYVMDMQRALISKTGSVPADTLSGLQLPNGNGYTMQYLESADNTNAFGIDLQLPEDRLTQIGLYLPNLRVPGIMVEVYKGNQRLLQRYIKDLWNGTWELLPLSGKVRIVLRSRDWWYSVKLGAVLFDDAAATDTAREDFDTRGHWKGVYGKRGYYLVGQPSALPVGVTLSLPHEELKYPLVWPAGVRHYTYRKNPVTPDNSGLGYSFDNVLLAFNVIPDGKDGMLANPPGTMPRYTGYKCTDYEYAMNPVAPEYGGGAEIWRLLTPGLNRKHFFPRQPKSEGEGPVKNGQLVIRREGNTVITECAIPWAELPDIKQALDKGRQIKLSFRVNDNGAPGSCMELAKERSVSKLNARAFHPDWKTHWANEVEFGIEK